jgi:hypothetical protein
MESREQKEQNGFARLMADLAREQWEVTFSTTSTLLFWFSGKRGGLLPIN